MNESGVGGHASARFEAILSGRGFPLRMTRRRAHSKQGADDFVGFHVGVIFKYYFAPGGLAMK